MAEPSRFDGSGFGNAVESWYSSTYGSKQETVKARLARAFADRLKKFAGYIPPGSPLEGWVPPKLEELKALREELAELAGWLFPRPWSQSELLLLLPEFDFSLEERAEIAEQPMPKGAPPKMRDVGMTALDLKEQRKWTWRRISREICPCGEPHTRGCTERVRQAAMTAQGVFDRYGV